MLNFLLPSRVPFRHRLARSAVAIIYRYRDEECELLLIKRSKRDGDPWSGHMAFPGGLIQAEDSSASDAAIREVREEIGIDLYRCARFSMRLSDLITRRHHRFLPMVVSPFLFLLTRPVEFTTNHEVEEVLWIPLAYFQNPANRETMIWEIGPLKLRLSCYRYEGRLIWGLTYLMIQNVIRKKI
ncbi:MAG: CoA pyrophosphatase [Ketobacteraceae bacterium]|nr:CoA pyrophosphatase [Ketobacteraceae bacterium]